LRNQETTEKQVGPDDVQVTQEEDGSATINFDPEAVNATVVANLILIT
jgi:hypothetical protein